MEALSAQLDTDTMPVHVAIIMDGNGRWANDRGLPRTAGHKKGVDAVRETVEGAAEMGIQYLTLFGFSSENWKRPESEVSDLMGLLRFYLQREITTLHKKNIRFRIIGDRTKLSQDIVKLIEKGENLTQLNQGLQLTIALSYGGHADITHAAKLLAQDVASGLISPEQVTEEKLAEKLSTSDLPNPDLLIRTSGEKRISNFLLWQTAYSEFVFVDTLWPDFDKNQLAEAVGTFQKRERRFGAVGS
ncbi:MAG: isoprenyl transferase [Rhodospirillales bacterium]|nr:isoprenyl transferase [Rhodospirillales bacterium]